jgi:L-ascorbate metabolism protein UlaG (beta-lactamase superfamily)
MNDRLTFLGHATVLLELAGQRLLTDPMLREHFLWVRRQVALPAPEHSERIDAVLISHQHADHLDFPSLRSVGGDPRTIVPERSARLLGRHRMGGAEELAPGRSVRVGEVEVTATEAEHDGRRWKIGRRAPAVGYLIEAPETSVYFAGDTDLFNSMEELRGRVDVAVLPIGGWGRTVDAGHLDPERAARAAAIIQPRVLVPIHWGTYLRGDVRRLQPELLHIYPRRLADELPRRAPGVDLRVLEPGESLDLSRLAFRS